MADICKRGAQQGRQADRFALAGKIQPMQQDGKLIQRQNAVRMAMSVMHRMIAGEEKISEALLLLR